MLDTYKLKIQKGVDTLSYTDKGWLVKIPSHPDQEAYTVEIPVEFNDKIQTIDGIHLFNIPLHDNSYRFTTRQNTIYIKFTNEFLQQWTLKASDLRMPHIYISYTFEDSTIKEYAWYRL